MQHSKLKKKIFVSFTIRALSKCVTMLEIVGLKKSGLWKLQLLLSTYSQRGVQLQGLTAKGNNKMAEWPVYAPQAFIVARS
jgi:hypothetical protein